MAVLLPNRWVAGDCCCDVTATPQAVHEVEVKYRVGDEAVLLAALAAHGVVLSDAVGQDDQAYAPAPVMLFGRAA